MSKFLPDLPPETQGIWTVCDGFHGDRNGLYRTGWLAAAGTSTGLTKAFEWMKYVYTATGTENIVAIDLGTVAPAVAATAYVYNGSTWNDRTGGTNVTNGRTEGIAQLGNITLVGTPSDGLFSRDASTTNNFAAVASSPNGRIVLVNALNIVAVFSAGTNGDDSWATSDFGDHTDWSSGAAASGNLRQTAGPITAAVAMGNDIIAFKRRGVYRGSYVGGTVKWKWSLVPGSADFGCWAPGCAVVVGSICYFYGDQGFMAFDGSQFRPMDDGIAATLKDFLTGGTTGLSSLIIRNTKLLFDPPTGRVLFFCQGIGPGSPANGFASGKNPAHYSFQTTQGTWGYQSRVTDANGEEYSAIVEGKVGTSDENTNPPSLVLFDATNNRLAPITTSINASDVGTNYKPKLRTSRLGTRGMMTHVSRCIPHWTQSDGAGSDLSTATVKAFTPYISDSPMEAEVAQSAGTLSTDLYRADYTKSARFQSVEIQINCEAVIAGVEFESKPSGRD